MQRNRDRDNHILRQQFMVGVLFLFLFTAPLSAQVIEEVEGKVEYRSPQGWVPAAPGDELGLGTTLSTGFGASAVLRIGESTLEVDQLTRMTIEELVQEDESIEADVAMDVGRVEARIRTAEGRRGEFTVKSPVATAAVRGTDFTFDGVDLQVTQDGPVLLQNQYGRTASVGAGQQARGYSYEAPRTPRETRQNQGQVNAETGESGETEGDESGVNPGLGGGGVEFGTVIIEVGF